MSVILLTGDRYKVDNLYQWDKDQELEISGLTLQRTPEIHFTNRDMDRAIVRQAQMDNTGVITVRIPNSMLQSSMPMIVYVCGYEGATFKTYYNFSVPIYGRAKPADYKLENTDDEIYSFNALENLIMNTRDEIIKDNNETEENVSEFFENSKKEVSEMLVDAVFQFQDISKELKSDVDTKVTALTERVDNIYIDSTPTEGNAELIDVRTDFEGTTHKSAGAAVRSQVEKLDTAIKGENERAITAESEIRSLFSMPTEAAVNKWLTEHPEAINPIEDHTLSADKLVLGATGFITPEQFGAVGDGETDDSKAFSDAIAYCAEHTIKRLLLTKTYNIKEVTVSYSGLEIYGGNIKVDPKECATGDDPDRRAFYVTGNYVTFKNVKFSSTRAYLPRLNILNNVETGLSSNVVFIDQLQGNNLVVDGCTFTCGNGVSVSAGSSNRRISMLNCKHIDADMALYAADVTAIIDNCYVQFSTETDSIYYHVFYTTNMIDSQYSNIIAIAGEGCKTDIFHFNNSAGAGGTDYGAIVSNVICRGFKFLTQLNTMDHVVFNNIDGIFTSHFVTCWTVTAYINNSVLVNTGNSATQACIDCHETGKIILNNCDITMANNMLFKNSGEANNCNIKSTSSKNFAIALGDVENASVIYDNCKITADQSFTGSFETATVLFKNCYIKKKETGYLFYDNCAGTTFINCTIENSHYSSSSGKSSPKYHNVLTSYQGTWTVWNNLTT